MQIDLPNVIGEIEILFARYEEALVSNNIDALNEFFWNDPRTIRYGVNENLYGHNAIAAFRSARANNNLQRVILRKHITTYGNDLATTNIEFKRADGEIGRQSQTWIRLPQGWRIVSAHVSVIGSER